MKLLYLSKESKNNLCSNQISPTSSGIITSHPQTNHNIKCVSKNIEYNEAEIKRTRKQTDNLDNNELVHINEETSVSNKISPTNKTELLENFLRLDQTNIPLYKTNNLINNLPFSTDNTKVSQHSRITKDSENFSTSKIEISPIKANNSFVSPTISKDTKDSPHDQPNNSFLSKTIPQNSTIIPIDETELLVKYPNIIQPKTPLCSTINSLPISTDNTKVSQDSHITQDSENYSKLETEISPIKANNSFVSSTIPKNSTNNTDISSTLYLSVNTLSDITPLSIEESVSINNSITEIAIDTNSINVNESTLSEYILESTASTSKEALESSKSVVEETESVDNPINVNKVLVPYSKNKTKKHFCLYCKTLQSKISRHLFLKHKDQKDVKIASALPKKSKERLKIIEKLRKEGDFIHNTSENLNSGILIVSRQQQSKHNNNVDNYVCCKHCKGFFSKRTLRIHLSKCGKIKRKRTNLIESRTLTQFIHSAANNVLKTKIFPVLRDDKITRSIRYDELIIKFGNKLSEKYSLEHQHDMIRANLRLLGRFIVELKKYDNEVKELKDIFKPNMFDKCIKALRVVANWDESLMWFKTPAVAQNLTSLIKKCGKKQRVELIKETREDLKEELENFLLLWEEETPTLINKKALEDQTNQKRIKKVVLPSKDDIKKLYSYLKNEIINAMENILNSFSISIWTKLVQATLIFIQIFNRRRAGEIERLTIENFNNKEDITENMDNDMLQNISNDSLQFAKQFVRITLRGKLGRTVSVLLCPMSVKAIEIILKFRSNAGITKDNKYIFSKPITSKITKMYYRACPLLKKFSEECGAQIPESLRGTTLRKHIATYTSLLNVEEASVDRLANFMGHHKDIHKGIYRMSVPVAEITCVSKLLMAAVGDEVENNVGDEESEEEDENILDQIQKQNTSSSSTIKRRSSKY